MDSISDKVKKIRVEYEDKPLNLEDLNQDPLEQFNTWFQIAIDAEVNEANAMAISTITQEGTPRSRYVLFKEIDDDKLKHMMSASVSYTHLTLPTILLV